jgi:hypothetical protein
MPKLIPVAFVLALAACADASNTGPTANAKIEAQGAKMRDVKNEAKVIMGAQKGGKIEQDISIDTKIALDPSSFGMLFGSLPSPIKNPSTDQLNQVVELAKQKGDENLQGQAQACLDRNDCIVQKN